MKTIAVPQLLRKPALASIGALVTLFAFGLLAVVGPEPAAAESGEVTLSAKAKKKVKKRRAKKPAVVRPVRDNGLIYACYRVNGKPRGEMRVLFNGKHCKGGERKVAWVAASGPGSPGATGAAGAPASAPPASSGPAGADGKDGAAGKDGLPDPTLAGQVGALSLKVDGLEGLLDGISAGQLVSLTQVLDGISAADLQGLLTKLDGISAGDLQGLLATLDGISRAELQSVIAKLNGISGQQLTEVLGLIDVLDGLTNSELTGAVDAIGDLTNAQLLGAVDAIGDLTNAQLLGAVNLLDGVVRDDLLAAVGLAPTVDELCGQVTDLVSQVNLLGVSFDGLLGKLLTSVVGVLLGEVPKAPPALSEFLCGGEE